jgi:hypothetical protein
MTVLLQSISGVSTINPLVAFYDTHGGKREVLFFYFVLDYYLQLLRVSESTLSRWFRLLFQSLGATPFPRRVDIRQVACRKN